MDALRRELSRYKMELSNRDQNFNRVFSDHQPVVVDPRAGKVGVTMAPATIFPREHGSNFVSQRASAKGPLSRERTLFSINHSLEDDSVHVSKRDREGIPFNVSSHFSFFPVASLSSNQLSSTSQYGFLFSEQKYSTVSTTTPSKRRATNDAFCCMTLT